MTNPVSPESALHFSNAMPVIGTILNELVPLAILDASGIIADANEAFCRLSGYTRNELIARPHTYICNVDDNTQLREHIWHTLRSNGTWSGELQHRHKDGNAYWVAMHIYPYHASKKHPIGYIVVKEDINARKKLEHHAATDPLTALYNRAKFNEIVALELEQFRRAALPASLIICDVDHFKNVNDTFGHLFGDKALQLIAHAIRTNIRSSDTAARWGGEEFIILLPNTPLENALLVAEKIRQAIEAAEFQKTLRLTASFGAAELRKHDNASSWFRRADEALFQAKEQGKNRVNSG